MEIKPNINNINTFGSENVTKIKQENFNEKDESEANHKNSLYKKIGAGALIIAGLAGVIYWVKKGKSLNNSTPKTSKGVEDIANKILGNQNSEELEKSAKEASKKAQKISALRRKFPELIVYREERHSIIQKNNLKKVKEQFDLDFYKDDFRAFVTIPSDRLKKLRESDNPELKEMFNIDRKNFGIDEGLMIHGSDIPEKKKLLQYFIDEAIKHEVDVIHIEAGNTDPVIFSQKIAKIFPEAKEKFLSEKKHTMIVIEDIDNMLNLTNKAISDQNSWARASINVHTNKCGEDGVIWVSTVKDLSKLDESCYRGGGGRVKYTIDIDKAVSFIK